MLYFIMLQLYFSRMEKKQAARLRAVLTSTPQKRHCKGSEQSPFLYIFKQMTSQNQKSIPISAGSCLRGGYGFVSLFHLLLFFNRSDEFKFKSFVLSAHGAHIRHLGISYNCLVLVTAHEKSFWPSYLVQNVVNLACFLLEGFFSSDKDVLEMPNLDCHCHPCLLEAG